MRNTEPSRIQIRPIAIVVATILILGSAIYAVLFSVARSGDEHQRETEETIVNSVLTQNRGKLSDTLVQNAYWDEAYNAISDSLDVKWADAHLGVYSEQTAGIPVTAIFDARGHAVYRYAPRLREVGAVLEASPTMAALVAQAQAAPVPPLPPRPFTAFVLVNGRAYVAAAQRVVPNDARARAPLARRFVLAYLVPIDALWLQRLQREFHIANLHQAPSATEGLASVALKGANGRTIAHLNWQAARPGEAFASAATPIALACFVLVGILQLVVLRSWMRAAQRMRDEGVAKTMFLANASHELRTPLNAILGFSECMTLELYGPLSARYKEYAGDIRVSGQHLLGIVNDVLDLSQLHNSETTTLQPVSLRDALIAPLRMLEEVARGEGIAIRFVEHCGDCQVMATEKALGQILLNLGSNAVKFSRAGRAVDVRLSRSPRGDFVDLIVEDRGAGIPEDKLRFIGQPFFQAHKNATHKPGSGLGLAIVKTLVERLQGEFSLESKLGVGTTVTVRLPIYRGIKEPGRSDAAA